MHVFPVQGTLVLWVFGGRGRAKKETPSSAGGQWHMVCRLAKMCSGLIAPSAVGGTSLTQPGHGISPELGTPVLIEAKIIAEVLMMGVPEYP